MLLMGKCVMGKPSLKKKAAEDIEVEILKQI